MFFLHSCASKSSALCSQKFLDLAKYKGVNKFMLCAPLIAGYEILIKVPHFLFNPFANKGMYPGEE